MDEISTEKDTSFLLEGGNRYPYPVHSQFPKEMSSDSKIKAK